VIHEFICRQLTKILKINSQHGTQKEKSDVLAQIKAQILVKIQRFFEKPSMG
jgi:hypothetical protein